MFSTTKFWKRLSLKSRLNAHQQKCCPRSCSVNTGSELISFSLMFKKIKALSIRVYPDTSVRVSAPYRLSSRAVEAGVLKKAPWIVKQKKHFAELAASRVAHSYISGEVHPYLGTQYRLRLVSAVREGVLLNGEHIEVHLNKLTGSQHVKKLLDAWYKKQASVHFQEGLERCLKLFKEVSLSRPTLKIRQMRSRWGSCSPNGSICLNLNLVKYPQGCIDFVLTHELCHLKHRNHGKQYYKLLSEVMPDWRERKVTLEAGNRV